MTDEPRLWASAPTELVGAETRRTGRFAIGTAAALVLTSSGVVETDTIPTLGLRLSADVTTLDVVLVVTVLTSLAVFFLRLLADLERHSLDQIQSGITLLQLEWDATLREVEEKARLDAFQDPAVPEESSRDAHRLERRLHRVQEDLSRLRLAGEAGSRFTPHAADRRVLEDELGRVRAELSAIGEASPESPAPSRELPERLRIATSYVNAIAEIQRRRRSFERSRMIRASRGARILLDVLLAPLAVLGSLFYWVVALQ